MNGGASADRRMRPFRVAAATAGVLFLALLGAPILCAGPEERFVETCRALTARGIVTTLAEWNEAGMVPGANGAAGIDAADEWLAATAGDDASWPIPSAADRDHGDWTDVPAGRNPGTVSEFLDRIRPWLERVEASSRQPTIRWPATDPADPDAPSPAGRLQRLARALHAFAEHGTSDEDRFRAVATGLRIAATIDARDLIVRMVADAISASAAADLRTLAVTRRHALVAARPELGPLLGRRASSELGQLARSLVVENAELLRAAFAGRLRGASGAPGLPARRLSVWGLYAFWWGGESWRTMEEVGRAADAGDMEPAAAIRAYASIDAGAPRLAKHATLVLPIVARRACRVHASLHVTRAGLAALALREATGSWPQSADELRAAFAEDLPADPFTGEPLRLTFADGTIRIESIGRLPEEAPLSEAELREHALVWEIPTR